ncbi:hypothetical protein EJ02DRAFT_472138 [Clathrospora elynae]|uniref:Rab-GAP TBC domain-containing protein n=1 Tax=Clathrospora elynae TaxID=706981 RepID=A0A6A5T5B9_9PLEO|nr:hypothetical protein EJ02DRAFT_472138 [Clathrospora elynae]
MGDTLLRVAPAVSHSGDTDARPNAAAAATAQYTAYRPSTAAEYTPPASPVPQMPYVTRKGPAPPRPRHPGQLHMDTAVASPYERFAYSPSAADSPIALPSPKFPRHRAPTLLRHAAVPPLYEGRPDAMSPLLAPAMTRQASEPRSPDLRAIFNPLASNPVNSTGPSWDSSTEDLSGPASPYRPRGMTGSSQNSFQSTPLLRSVTSTPDYSQHRGNERTNLSGTYKPNRGVPNWSHTDYYPPPPRPFRGEEPRASFRSGWTNASSSVLETSGTERSSIVTARSSILSERQNSTYSRDQSRDRFRYRDDSPETIQTSEIAEEDDGLDAVGDVLDAYYYDEDDEERSPIIAHSDRDHMSPSPAGLDSEPPGLSQTPSRDFDSLDSFQSSESLKQWDDRPQLQALALGTSSAMDRLNLSPVRGHVSKGSNINRSQLNDIRRDISGLPQLPMSRSRLSRQDWANIEAYSKTHSQRPSASRTISKDSIVGKFGPQSPPPQRSDPFPELDEDETIPRRASTSVFDRKSTLFDLGMMSQLTAARSKPESARSPTLSVPTEQIPSVTPGLRKMAAPVERDRYGFKKASDKINVQEYNAWASKYEDHISRRRNKWIILMSKQGLPTNEPTKFPEMCEKVKRYARKGYPPEWRGAMWWYYSGGQHVLAQNEMVGLYKTLVARVNQDELNKDDKDAIERDLDRTFPDNIHFRSELATDLLDGESDDEPVLIRDLREVLSCFALNNPNIGYCQSLNFIAGLLLLFLKQDKEKVFIILTIITHNHLPGAHARSLANTEVNVLMMLIKDYLPKVWASINDTDLINSGAGSNAHPNSKFQRQPTVALSCTSWFMSIFVGVVPIETVLRIWDAFLYEGPRALYRYALAIFKLGEPEIKKYRPGDGEIFMAVQTLPRRCLDPNILHDLAFVKKGFGNLSQNVIDQKRMFWREQNKMAHQTSVKNTGRLDTQFRDEDDDVDSLRKTKTGLRRRASRKFRQFGIK